MLVHNKQMFILNDLGLNPGYYLNYRKSYVGLRRWKHSCSAYELFSMCRKSDTIFLSRGLQIVLAIPSFSSIVIPYSYIEYVS